MDELGGRKEAIAYIEQTLNITAEPVEYKQPSTFFSELSKLSTDNFYQIGRGIGSVFTTETKVTLT